MGETGIFSEIINKTLKQAASEAVSGETGVSGHKRGLTAEPS
jgi:hypothetical protein